MALAELRGWVARHLPGVAWRDRRIEHLGARLAGAELRLDSARTRADDLARRLESTQAELDAVRTALRQRVDQLTAAHLDDDIATTRRGDPPPSFRYKLAELRRIGSGHLRELGTEEPVQSITGKREGYAFARSHGVRVPDQVGSFASPDEIDFDALPERFVLKPAIGHSGRGVFLLVADGDGYRSLSESAARVRPADIVARLKRLVARGRIDGELVVEELLTSADRPDLPPIDWKLTCFMGEVGLILGRDTRGRPHAGEAGFRWFDPSWNDLGPVRLEVSRDPQIPLPPHPDELVAVAGRLASAIPRPAVRVDLYDTPEHGVVFGEITSHSGGRYILPTDVDRMLGERWEKAEARLLARVAGTGVLDISFGDGEVSPGGHE